MIYDIHWRKIFYDEPDEAEAWFITASEALDTPMLYLQYETLQNSIKHGLRHEIPVLDAPIHAVLDIAEPIVQ